MVNVRRGSRQHQEEGELLLDFPAEAAWELMLGWMVFRFKTDVIYIVCIKQIIALYIDL